MIPRSRSLPWLAVLAVLVARSPALADSAQGAGGDASATSAVSAAPTSSAAGAVDELERRVKALEQLRDRDKEADAKKADAVIVTANAKDGFSLKSADGAFALKLSGLVQTDVRVFVDDDETPLATTLLVRRARPIVEGTVYKYFEFKLVPDFGGMSKRQVVETSVQLGMPVELLGKGIVRSQTPVAGSVLREGERIRVYFAR